MVEGALGDAIGILVRIGGGMLVWFTARHFATEYEPLARASAVRAYSRVAIVCAIAAFFAWATYGTHVEDADPLFGGGDVVADFTPSASERDRHGIVTFLVLLVLAGHGTWRGRTDWREQRASAPDEERETARVSTDRPLDRTYPSEREGSFASPKYCARCARLVPEPPTSEISRYASYWRGMCPSCLMPLTNARDS